MPKARKTIGSVDAPYIASLKALMRTQSKETIARWCLDYTEQNILPIFERTCPGDARPRMALEASRRWFQGEIKLPQVKRIILDECHAAARECEDRPAAQAAARACGQAAACCHAPTHALGIVFYGAAAIAYDRVGCGGTPATYEAIAAGECAQMEAALRAIAVEKEPNRAKLNWRH